MTSATPRYAPSRIALGGLTIAAALTASAAVHPTVGAAAALPGAAMGPLAGAAPTKAAANLWVDVDGGACKRRARPGAYANAAACSWKQAYRKARTGDVILVKGGNYGNVALGPNRPAISPPGVTFRTAPGEKVVVRDFENGYIDGGASNVRFLGPVTARTFRSDGADNIVVVGWRVDCNGCDGVQIFHVENANKVTVRNSDIGDNNNAPLIWINGSNLTFDNNRIHDAGLPAGSGAHTECMYVWSVTNLRLTRNYFYHCAVMDVFITGGSEANGGYIENNVFEKPWENTGVISRSAYAFHFRTGGHPSPDPNNWDFRYNTFVGSLSISPEENLVGPGGMRVIGNVFLAGSPCGHRNTSYSHNAFVSRGCGKSRITRKLTRYLRGFANTADPGDYSLRSGSVLRDRGSRASYPKRDRRGGLRYRGSAPDIGAYEFRVDRK